MGITIIEKPFSATSKVNNHELLLIALSADQTGYVHGVCVDDEGNVSNMQLADININLRYDDRRHVWVDANLAPEEDTDEES